MSSISELEPLTELQSENMQICLWEFLSWAKEALSRGDDISSQKLLETLFEMLGEEDLLDVLGQ